jgi:hypothetical protein
MADVGTRGGGAAIEISRSTASGAAVSLGSSDEIAVLREAFRRDYCVLLPGFFDAGFTDEISHAIQQAAFYHRQHGKIGSEGCMEANPTLARLLFAINDPRVFGAIDAITGCGSIGCFDGRVYRLGASGSDGDSWHNDLGDNRLVALSVNVGIEPYLGGELQIRDVRSGEIVNCVRNADPGDAVLFRISPDLEHQVTPVEGSSPRTAFAGWFKSRPSFRAVIEGAGWSAP